MAALTSGKALTHQLQTDTLLMPVAAGVRIFPGALVCSNFRGFAVPAADEAYYVFEGIAMHPCDVNGSHQRLTNDEADNRLGDDGDIYIKVQRRGRVRVVSEDAAAQAYMSCRCYIVDDQTVAVVPASTTHEILCGRMDRLISASEIEMSIDCRTHCTSKESIVTSTAAEATTTTTGQA